MKYSVITGASHGIGQALSREFAKKGHNLIVVARNLKALTDLKEELEGKYKICVQVLNSDLSSTDDLNQLLKSLDKYELNTLINNAGMGDYAYSWQQDQDKVEKMLEVNIMALTKLSLYFVKKYNDEEATLINVSSGGGYFVFNKAVTYCASKFYVSAFTEGMAQNLKINNKKLKAKILCPGGTNTGFVGVAESQFKGDEIFNMTSFLEPEILATYAYNLYESDFVIGMVDENNEFVLRDPIFPFG